jgi:hypothetical protein
VALHALLLGCGAATGQELRPRGTDAPKPVAIPLRNADAEYAAGRLKTLLGPSVEVATDKESNTVFLRADSTAFQWAKALL